jgi:hypothetical protein
MQVENGWATEKLIVEYLQWLHAEIAGGHPCVLILYVYPTYRTEVGSAAAEECDIELRSMRAGGTNEYQPLDYRIFGELKSRVKAETTRLMAIRSAVNIDHDQNVGILVRYWNAISGENIRRAWELPSLARAVVSEQKATEHRYAWGNVNSLSRSAKKTNGTLIRFRFIIEKRPLG